MKYLILIVLFMGCSSNPVKITEESSEIDWDDDGPNKEKECEWWEFWEDCD